jgi:hypothetical protein
MDTAELELNRNVAAYVKRNALQERQNMIPSRAHYAIGDPLVRGPAAAPQQLHELDEPLA